MLFRRMRRYLANAALVYSLSLVAARPAWAELAEEWLRLPTDGTATHLFPVNPADLAPKGFRAGALGVHNTRESIMDHTSTGGDKLDSQIADDFAAVALNADLGAGAGIGLEQELQYHKVTTTDSFRTNDPKSEIAKNQETNLKLEVELVTGLEAALSVRYLQKDITVLGDPGISNSMSTRYKATIVGIGTGASYNAKGYGGGYTYYPPLHGKTEIYGQEEIIVEPGFITVNAYWQPSGTPLTLAILGQRWLNEVDDLAVGTTASDNKTKISLYGLDPDQYLVRDEELLLGGDFAFSKAASVRFAVGEEIDHFDFAHLLVYNGLGVQNQNGNDRVTTLLGRAAAHYSNSGVDIDAGFGLFRRSYGFSQAEGSGSYSANGQQLFLTFSVRL